MADRHQYRDESRHQERGFTDRARDEVRSWFGDEDAARRRRFDERDTWPDDMRPSSARERGLGSSEREWRDEPRRSTGGNEGHGYYQDARGRVHEFTHRGDDHGDDHSMSSGASGYGAYTGRYNTAAPSQSVRRSPSDAGEGGYGAGGYEAGGYGTGSYGSDRDDWRLAPGTPFGPNHDRELYGRTHEWQGRPDYVGRGPKGYRRGDDRVREDVCESLARDARVDASDVEVEVKEGEVTLSGFVRTRDEKHRTEDLIESIPGVRDVHNHLRVSGTTSV